MPVQKHLTSLLWFSTSSDHALFKPRPIVSHPCEAVEISAGSTPVCVAGSCEREEGLKNGRIGTT